MVSMVLIVDNGVDGVNGGNGVNGVDGVDSGNCNTLLLKI